MVDRVVEIRAVGLLDHTRPKLRDNPRCSSLGEGTGPSRPQGSKKVRLSEPLNDGMFKVLRSVVTCGLFDIVRVMLLRGICSRGDDALNNISELIGNLLRGQERYLALTPSAFMFFDVPHPYRSFVAIDFFFSVLSLAPAPSHMLCTKSRSVFESRQNVIFCHPLQVPVGLCGPGAKEWYGYELVKRREPSSLYSVFVSCTITSTGLRRALRILPC